MLLYTDLLEAPGFNQGVLRTRIAEIGVEGVGRRVNVVWGQSATACRIYHSNTGFLWLSGYIVDSAGIQRGSSSPLSKV